MTSMADGLAGRTRGATGWLNHAGATVVIPIAEAAAAIRLS